MTVIRTEDQKADDRENLRENVRRITEELEIAGIPYDRILREYEAAIYVPNIEDNQVMIALVGLRGAVPMQLCRRDVTGFRGGQYQSTDSLDEAVRLVKAWYRKPDGKKVPKNKRAM